MSESSDAKKQLGRILLQRKLVTPEGLEALLQRQRSEGARLASVAADSGAINPAELLSALSEQQGLPAVDLRRVRIDLAALEFVPVDIARQHLILPLVVKDERLFLAMADPDNKRVIDEIEFVTGKRIFPYVALHGALRDVLEAAYAAREAGETSYAGPLAGKGEEIPLHPDRPSRPGLLPGSDDALVSSPPADVFDDELSGPLVEDSSGPAIDDVFSGLSTGAQIGGQATGVQKPKRRILVVDDSDDIRQLLVRVFRERDFEVFESSRGLDALQKVREAPPDVLLLDAMLPEVHGFDICRRIKGSRRYGHIPVVMVSAIYRGWRFAEDLRRSYGVDEFLEKPFRINEVVAAVERALNGQSTHKAAEDDADNPAGAAGDHLKAGIEAYARGDVEGAIEQLKSGIGIDPLAFRLHYHLGLLYGKQDNVFDAIQALETASDLRPRDFSTLKNLAVLYQRAGFRLKATEMWERALGSAPDDSTRANIKNHLVSLL
ncbi:MAG: response regulator [Myxococcales bacterium]